MDLKDILTASGILATLSLGVWNFIHLRLSSRQTRLVDTITSERVKWMLELKANMSKLCGGVHSWMLMYSHEPTPSPACAELLKEIDRLRYEVRLQLNPDKPFEKGIEDAVLAIPTLTNKPDCSELQAALDAITAQTQKLLRAEWKIVKAEVITGKLAKENLQQL